MAAEGEEVPPDGELRIEYLRCKVKGRMLYSRLCSFDPTDCENKAPGLTSRYKVEERPMRRLDKAQERMGLWGVDPKNFSYLEVRNKLTPDRSDAIYTNRSNGRDGTLIHIGSYKGEDQNPEALRLFPSEVAWRSWLSAAARDETSPSSLRFIVRDSIKNKATRMVIWHSARWSNCSESDSKGYRVYTKYHSGFFALLGSINGASTMRMLLDHKAEIGFRTVDRMVVFAEDEDDHTTQFGKLRSFMIVLSDPRMAPARMLQTHPD